ncbi:MAG TPA: deoxyribodipyrimidine photolyase [Kofleriaceae bacterium]|mgnify:CR=1 FL=1|nr:deoxyribodipyrimidine photolyase [Kofleriaceae bacterium]
MTSLAAAPDIRCTALNNSGSASAGHYVLYWMTAARRTEWNFGLEHAIARANQLGKPLLVLEALRVGYQWANDRHHSFVLAGMADNAAAFAAASITYLPYIEPTPGAGSGLFEALAAAAALIVVDEFPCFFLPRMIAAAAARVAVRVESIDGNGVMPLRATAQAYPTAASFRRHWQKVIHPHLLHFPVAAPLEHHSAKSVRHAVVPASILQRWPMASTAMLANLAPTIAALPIDHNVAPAAFAGGARAAHTTLDQFIADRLDRYGERSQPEQNVASGLSPYLHFGHISAHQIISAVWQRSAWEPAQVAGAKASGSRDGWWGLPSAAEGFMDEILTWRELGYSFCFHRSDYDRYESLPPWARKSLDEHASDPRAHTYTLAQFESAATHDPLWNAAQTQLVREGRMHNYLRMLWGKKILEWTSSPQTALAVMIELNNKYAVDGRNPNSYSGIFWTLGRFDRPWAPLRPIFGCIRYMSSDNTAKKFRVKNYIAQYSTPARQTALPL